MPEALQRRNGRRVSRRAARITTARWRRCVATRQRPWQACCDSSGALTRDGKASVGLHAYPTTHPFARIQLTDNIVLFRTSRYRENPLVVQGPGAGREVTAAGVFADLLRLASYLGAPL